MKKQHKLIILRNGNKNKNNSLRDLELVVSEEREGGEGVQGTAVFAMFCMRNCDKYKIIRQAALRGRSCRDIWRRSKAF